jgi:hypothetical protein
MLLANLTLLLRNSNAFLYSHFSKVVNLGSNSLIVIAGPGTDSFNSVIAISFNWLITSGLARQQPATMLEVCRPEVMQEQCTLLAFPVLIDFLPHRKSCDFWLPMTTDTCMCNLLFYHTPPRLIIITGLFVATYLTS